MVDFARPILQEIDKRIAEALRRVGFIGNTYDFSRGGGTIPMTALTYGTPTATIDIGDSASAGTANSALRSDAQFAFTAPSASYPQPAGTVLSDGTATTPARSDHVHAQRLTIFEADGTPSVSNVIAIQVSNATLTNNGGGTVALTTGGGGGGSVTVMEIDGTPNVSGVTTIKVSNGTLTDDTGGTVTITTAGGTATLTVQESDGTPLVANVNTIKVSNGSLTDNGGGTVTITTSGGSGNVISSTAYGSEPGSPTDGDTDLYTASIWIGRYSSTAGKWQPWGPIYQLSDPNIQTWSWDNQGSATVSTTNGGVYLATPANATGELHVRYMTAPATPYSFRALLIPDGFLGGAFVQYGIGFRESSTGKLVMLQIVWGSPSFYVRKWTSSTSFSADYANKTVAGTAFDLRSFLRVRDDGTTLYFELSNDGIHFYTFYSVSRTDFMAGGPDQVCFAAAPLNASAACNILVADWTRG